MIHALVISCDEEFTLEIKNKLELFNYKVSALEDLALAHVFIEQPANVLIFDTTGYNQKDIYHITKLSKTQKRLPAVFIYPEEVNDTDNDSNIKVLKKPIKISDLLVFVDEGTRESQRLPKVDLSS